MSYSIFERRDDGTLRRLSISRLRHDQLLPVLPSVASAYSAELVVQDQHGRLVATVSPDGDVTTTPALHQPTR